MPPGGLGKIALRAMPVRLASSSNGLGVAALWVEFPPDPLRVAAQCFMPKPFAFSAQNTVPPFRASQSCPFFMSWNGKRPPLVFLHAEPGNFRQGTIRCGSGCFSCETGKLCQETVRCGSATVSRPVYKSLWKGWGRSGGGGENLSPERFPRPLQPSAFLQNVKDARIKPVALVGGEGLKTDFEVAGINRGAVHGFNFIDGEFPLVP